MTSASAVKKGFIPEIEALRGVAAFTVMATHCFWFYLPPTPQMFSSWQGWVSFIPHVVMNENSAVTLFLMLSGFVLRFQWDNQPDYLAFVTRRIFRLSPPMWTAATFAFGMALITGTMQWSAWPRLVEAMTYRGYAVSGPLWSIVAEMWCGLLWPLLYLLVRRGGTAVVALAVVVLAAVMQDSRSGPIASFEVMVLWALANGLLYFLLGILIVSWGKHVVGRKFLLIGFPLYAFPAFSPIFQIGLEVWARVSAVGAFIILANVVHGQAFHGLLQSRVARFLGKISYSVYLIHFTVLQFFLSVFGATSTQPLLAQFALLIGVVSITIPLAMLNHRFVEVPSNQLGRALTKGGSPLAVSAP